MSELTDLLQARAQVAAEHKANPVYFHAMNAGLHVAFLHPLKVGVLLEDKWRTPSAMNHVNIGSPRASVSLEQKYERAKKNRLRYTDEGMFSPKNQY